MTIIMYLLYAAVIILIVLLILDYLKQKKVKPETPVLVRTEYTHVEEDPAPKVSGPGGGFSVILKEVPIDKQISIMNAVRLATGLSLYDAKILMESAPAMIKENISYDEAHQIKELLVQAHAKVSIKNEKDEETQESSEEESASKTLKPRKKKSTSTTKKTKKTTKASTKKTKDKEQNND